MTIIRLAAGVLLFVSLSVLAVAEEESCLKVPSGLPEESCNERDDSAGTQWAILIAGSNGYWNYRHQADVCHAYQILKKGGLKDENIVVFMYDDIAYNEDNPRPGVIINHPNGSDVYEGVPKDYTGKDVNSNNFYAAILGNKTAIKGGSGKVVNSGPNDHIFIYYTDHGGPGVLAMPSGDDNIYANALIDVLKKKHASGTYKSLVFYLEACESGSIFEGLLPEGLNIYATTASGADENSWGTYCPSMHPSPPPEYDTCLGDLYSVAWMEDCDKVDLRSETLKLQYERVKKRTIKAAPQGSHVMQYGNLSLSTDELYRYFGETNKNGDYTSGAVDSDSPPQPIKIVHQRDADLLHLWGKFFKAPEGSTRKLEAQTQIVEAMSHRMHVDSSMKMVGELVFGIEKGHKVLNNVRPAGQPLVDDWDCLKSLVKTFEKFCGSLSQYGMRHTGAIANMCNAGITKDQMAEAASQACSKFPTYTWTSRLYPQGFNTLISA